MAVAASAAALDRVLTDVRERWGQGSIVRLDSLGPTGGHALPAGERRALRRQQPPWWPLVLPDGSVVRPGVVEVLAPPGGGRLSLALAWLAAARPTLAAFVTSPEQGKRDTHSGLSRLSGLSGGIPFPPSAVQSGIDLERLILVRPPRALDAVAVLLRSEAFDVVVCTLPSGTRVSTTFAGKLATLASRSGTTLFLLNTTHAAKAPTRSPPPKRLIVPFTVIHGGAPMVEMPAPRPSGLLTSFADFRLTISSTRPLWTHSQFTGLRLAIRTERARAADPTDHQDHPGAITQELTLRLGQPPQFRLLTADPSETPVPESPTGPRLVSPSLAPSPPAARSLRPLSI